MYTKLDIIKSDEHLERLVKFQKRYCIQYVVDEKTYNNIQKYEYIIIGIYNGEEVYGRIENKNISPRQIYAHLGSKIEHTINILIMANAKIELKPPLTKGSDIH